MAGRDGFSRRIVADVLAGEQTMGAAQDVRPGQLGDPVIWAVFEAQLAPGAVLVIGPALSQVHARGDAGRGMRIELRIFESDRKDGLLDMDIRIDAEPYALVEAPHEIGKPGGVLRQRRDRAALMVDPRGVLEELNHAKPAGLTGPVWRFGKASPLAMLGDRRRP